MERGVKRVDEASLSGWAMRREASGIKEQIADGRPPPSGGFLPSGLHQVTSESVVGQRRRGHPVPKRVTRIVNDVGGAAVQGTATDGTEVMVDSRSDQWVREGDTSAERAVAFGEQPGGDRRFERGQAIGAVPADVVDLGEPERRGQR
ncbi:hypothetical protein, partial [Frankia sp. CpI1-P]|uniref:hypothetical protein n=1 Tax=Frankia sp. CpI1-P TaxID=1502734 RepID=UPI001A7E5E46